MEKSTITKWSVKGKAARFSRHYFGYLLHHIGNSPTCIMGFENTGTPYSAKVYEMFEDRHPDIKHGEISVNNGKITGFRKDCIQNRKVIVITENPRDRGFVYASDITETYRRLKDRYNIKGLEFITVEPFKIYQAEELMRKGFL